MKGEFNYANGLSISQSRQIFRYVFGDFFIKADKNDKELRFDIYVFDKIITEEEGVKKIALLSDWCDTDYFNEFWNKQGTIGTNKKGGVFNLIICKLENAELDSIKK